MPTGPETANHLDRALATYLAPLVLGRRVLFIGPDAGGPAELRESAKAVQTHSEPLAGALPYSPKSFDVVVIPDLEAVRAHRVENLVSLRRVMSDAGVIVAGVTSEGAALDYDGLYDLLASGFEHVKMVGQAPLSAYVLVEYGVQAPDVSFDGHLASEAPPEPVRFFAIAARNQFALDSFVVVQTPPHAQVASSPATHHAPVSPAVKTVVREVQDPALIEELKAAHEHAEELEHELASQSQKLEAQLTHAKQELEKEFAKAQEQLKRDLEAGARELEKVRAAHAEVSDELRSIKSAADGDEASELVQLETQLEEAGAKVLELQREVDRRGTLTRDLLEELRVVRVPAPAQIAPAASDNSQARIAQLEGTIRGLEVQLADVQEVRAELEAKLQMAREDQREAEAKGNSGAAESPRQVAAQRDAARAEALHLTAVIANLEQQAAGARRGYEARARELAFDLDAERHHWQRTTAELRGERDGLRWRLHDRESALSSGPQESPTAQTVTELRTALETAQKHAHDMEERARSAMTEHWARDTLVSRLQMDLAAKDKVVAQAEERLHTLGTELDHLRQSMADAAAAVETKDRLAARLAELETSLSQAETRENKSTRVRGEAREALTEARADLISLGRTLDRIMRSGTQNTVSVPTEDADPN